jgi:hypothetical protein
VGASNDADIVDVRLQRPLLGELVLRHQIEQTVCIFSHFFVYVGDRIGRTRGLLTFLVEAVADGELAPIPRQRVLRKQFARMASVGPFKNHDALV